MEEHEKRLISIALSADPDTAKPILESYGVDASMETMDQHASVLESKVIEAIERSAPKPTLEESVVQETAIVHVEPKLSALTKTGIYAATYGRNLYKAGKAVVKYTTMPFLLPLLPQALQLKITKKVENAGAARFWCNIGSMAYDSATGVGTGLYLNSLMGFTDDAMTAAQCGGGVGLALSSVCRLVLYNDRYNSPKYSIGTFGPFITEAPAGIISLASYVVGHINSEAQQSILQKEKELKEKRLPPKTGNM